MFARKYIMHKIFRMRSSKIIGYLKLQLPSGLKFASQATTLKPPLQTSTGKHIFFTKDKQIHKPIVDIMLLS